MSNHLTQAELDEAKRLCEKVTPGPWTVGVEEYEDKYGDISIPEISRLLHGTEWAEPEEWDTDLEIAKFIALARTLLPHLIAEVARLRKVEKAVIRVFGDKTCGCINDLPGDNYTCTAHEMLIDCARKGEQNG
jgi:hypothetical protein